jgi:hypothetical protein
MREFRKDSRLAMNAGRRFLVETVFTQCQNPIPAFHDLGDFLQIQFIFAEYRWVSISSILAICQLRLHRASQKPAAIAMHGYDQLFLIHHEVSHETLPF